MFQCWADFDKFLMEDVVPCAPYLFDNSVDIISDNVINYSFDQFAADSLRSISWPWRTRADRGDRSTRKHGTMRRGSRRAAPSRRARIWTEVDRWAGT